MQYYKKLAEYEDAEEQGFMKILPVAIGSDVYFIPSKVNLTFRMKNLRFYGGYMEVRNYRCCMCPQIDMNENICPTGPGKSQETKCDFVVMWMDQRGWKYKVMGDIAGTFKGRYQDDKHSGSFCWHGMRQMGRRERFDQAQEDLNRYAKSKGWHPVNNKDFAEV